jgi:serine/threonine-protein kinase
MSIGVGTRLGYLEITALLGKGGMGEVYRARDLKLKREVAIKILPEEFAHDSERVNRFQREAEVLASINHPNIAGIYDLQEASGCRYLVLELVEGETLADRIARGPIPLKDALEIAKQICEALEAAHERGIIHRDLKPANVKITPEGNIKVLDFGLAKAFEAKTAADPQDKPTIATGAGLILGTPGYMSPEQAREKEVDKRADIWSFGVILYEILTGQKLFGSESVSDTLAAVLTREPSWDRIPPKTRRLLQSCLEKDPKHRLRDIADVWKLLDDGPNLPQRSETKVVWVLIVCLIVATVAASWGWWRAMLVRESTLRPLVRLDLDLGPDVSVGTSIGAAAILSPDETRLVFISAGSGGVPTLFTRLLDQPKATPLPETAGANAPFFSPDGEWVAFFSGGKLKKTRIFGGDPIPLCDAPAGRGGAWSEDGTIIAALDTRTGLSRISPDGRVTPLTTLEAGEVTHRWPRALPGGKGVIFTVSTSPNNYGEAGIALVSAATGWKKKILLSKAGMSPQYIPTGHLVYAANTTVYAVPFDLDGLEVNGSPLPVLEGVSADTSYGLAQMDFSRSGTILYRQDPAPVGRFTIRWLDRGGETEMVWPESASYLSPRVAPDGSSRLAVVVTQRSTSDIWIYDWQRGNRTKLNDGSLADSYPVWSPDGQYVFFQSANGIFWARADGTEREPLTKSKIVQTPTSFSREGGVLAFFERNPGGGALIKTVNVDYASGRPVAGEPQTFLETPSSSPYPALSPDGRWLAYASTEDGPYQVYVRAYPNSGKKWSISTSGGQNPVWSRTTPELFFRSDDGRIMMVTYSAREGNFVATKPQPFTARQFGNAGRGLTPNFDLAPDSRRFAVLMPSDVAELEGTRSHITLVLNFFDEVRRRLTTSKR